MISSTPAISSAAIGIHDSLAKLDKAADQLAQKPVGPKAVESIAQLKLAEQGVSYSAEVFRTADRLLGIVIDAFV